MISLSILLLYLLCNTFYIMSALILLIFYRIFYDNNDDFKNEQWCDKKRYIECVPCNIYMAFYEFLIQCIEI